MPNMTERALGPKDIHYACVCHTVRKTARALIRRYDAQLKPAGVTSGQFGILNALWTGVASSLTTLADALGMDRTTLNRNLRPLEEQGLVRSVRTDDLRVRRLELTKAGLKVMHKAIPLWEMAQKDSSHRLTGMSWNNLRNTLKTLM